MSKTYLKKLWHKNYMFWSYWSTAGLLLAALFLAISLSPSLVPRPLLLQGIASGIALSMGYFLGLCIITLWRYLELPEIRGSVLRYTTISLTTIVGSVLVYFYVHATQWQNSVRILMDMPLTDGVAVLQITVIAFILWFTIVYLVIGIKRLYIASALKVHTYIPRRISYVASGFVLTFFLITLINGILITKAIDVVDNMFAAADQAIPDDLSPSTSPLRSGGPKSLIPWNDLGHEGKYFVSGGPTPKQISNVSKAQALEPIRIYVGLSAADTPAEQAALALAELKRTNAFARNKLVIATPTGTGWIDAGAIDTFEYLHDGDTATVGVQYSYLSSPITLILDPNRARISAKAVFKEIYGYWKTLAEDSRPELYLFGLSLGSLGSEDSMQLYSLLSDPITGALWAGAPFANTFWPQVIVGRNPGSPAYQPQLGKGDLVRVLGAAPLDINGSEINNPNSSSFDPWGPLKIVYLVHPSDAIVFFDFNLFHSAPDWLTQKRGADVSPDLTWYPLVTMWQIGLDMLVTTNVPYGHGHNYAPTDYLRAWVELEDKREWSDEYLQRLIEQLTRQ